MSIAKHLIEHRALGLEVIATEIVAVSAPAFSIPNGLGTTTGLDLVNVILDTDGTLADLVNNYVNVPASATHCRCQANGFFAANATGSRKIAFEQHIAGAVWVAIAQDEKPNAGAAISTYFSFTYPMTTVNAASAPHVRLAAAQDSGAALNFTLSSLMFEFLKVA